MSAVAVEDAQQHRRPMRIAGPSWGELATRLRRPHRLLAELARRMQEDRTANLAAALTYYFFFAFFPFLLFLLALVSVLPVHGLEDWVLFSAGQVVPGEAYGMLERTVRGLLAQPQRGLLSVGAVLALWAASAAMASLMDGLNRAYRVPEGRPWWLVRLAAIGLTVGLSAFMILAFVLTVFGGQLAGLVSGALGPAGLVAVEIARWGLGIGLVTIVVAALYHTCPNVEQPWRWVTPGSVVFTLGFGATSAGFSYYVGQVGSYDRTYGSLGAVIILLLWMYLLAFFLVLGGQVNALLDCTVPPPARATEDGARGRE